MAKIDKTYKDLLKKVVNTRFKYEDSNRKGVYRLQIPHYQFEHSFENGFPILTTKEIHWKSIVGELLWFLRGDTNIKYLVDNGIKIWNKDAYNWYKKQNGLKEPFLFDYEFVDAIKNHKRIDLGDLGRIYGSQWRKWNINMTPSDEDYGGYFLESLDQISKLIKGLKENPMGTRHIVTAWNPAELDDMALPPCHWSFEILVEPLDDILCADGVTKASTCKHSMCNKDSKFCSADFGKAIKYRFTLKWHQRSVDTFLGLPFNVASYALLAHIIGKLTNMVPKGIIGDLSNVHIYEPHIEAVTEQLKRNSEMYWKSLELNISKKALVHMENMVTFDQMIQQLDIEDFTIPEYKSHPPIKAEMIPYDNN